MAAEHCLIVWRRWTGAQMGYRASGILFGLLFDCRRCSLIGRPAGVKDLSGDLPYRQARCSARGDDPVVSARIVR